MDGAVPQFFLTLLAGVVVSFGLTIGWIAMRLFGTQSGNSSKRMAVVAKTNVWIASATFCLFLFLWNTPVRDFVVIYAAPVLFALSVAVYISQRRLSS